MITLIEEELYKDSWSTFRYRSSFWQENKNFIQHPEGLASEITVSTVAVLLQREKRKLRNHVMSPVRIKKMIKQSIKLSLTGKMISGPLKFLFWKGQVILLVLTYFLWRHMDILILQQSKWFTEGSITYMFSKQRTFLTKFSWDMSTLPKSK